jgi:histidinol-phosphatase
VILREAGGRFTDLRGGDGFDRGSGLATNGHLHDRLVELLRPDH